MIPPWSGYRPWILASSNKNKQHSGVILSLFFLLVIIPELQCIFAGMAEELTNELLRKAAARFGTPLYVYHAERITAQYQQLQQAFAGTGAVFFYAAKALTNINILRLIKNIGCHTDCSSINEVRLALMAGFAPEEILYTSSNVAFEEIEEAKNAAVHINIDSLSNLEKFGKKFGSSYPVGVRIRPNIMAGGNLKISTGHSGSKFGIPVENLSDIVRIREQTGLRVRTLHLHTGSEIKDVDVFAKGIDVLLEAALQIPEAEVIDLGGGFKVPYMPGEEGTDIRQLAVRVAEKFRAFEAAQNRRFRLWFEPGKYLVSEAGYLVTTVHVLKQAADTCFAGVNSGLNHFIRPMFYGAYHEILNISNPAAVKKMYTVAGNICETDTFAEDRMIAEIREGDLLVFRNAGAYGFEMSSQYNARFRPAEVLISKGESMLIRRRETLEDLLRTQLLIP